MGHRDWISTWRRLSEYVPCQTICNRGRAQDACAEAEDPHACDSLYKTTCSPGLSDRHVMQADVLDKQSLATVNAYNPGLSGAWMLQRAMSVRPGEQPNPDFINQVTLMPCHAWTS